MIRNLLLLLCLSATLNAQEAGDEGFVPLFNGRDLTGWVNVNGGAGTWTVREGLLHCDGVPTGALRTDRQYENFVMEAEWRHLKPGGNAGIFIWAGPLTAVGQPFLRSIEVQVLDHGYGQTESYTTHGDVFPIHGSTMKPMGRSNGQRSFPSEERSNPSPEWNHYRITCQDGTLRLAVNGKEVSGGTDCHWRKGYIALESEGGLVDWRNLRIKELPGGKATPAETAPLADGSVTLYDGRSLEGWSAPGGEAGWRAADWQLVTTGGGLPLVLNKKPGDFRLQFDAKMDGGEAADSLPICVNGQPLPGKTGAAWTRYVITRSGEEVTCEVQDGKNSPSSKVTVAAGPAEISFKSGKPLRLASLYIRE